MAALDILGKMQQIKLFWDIWSRFTLIAHFEWIISKEHDEFSM
jgi:hypothetical protein